MAVVHLQSPTAFLFSFKVYRQNYCEACNLLLSEKVVIKTLDVDFDTVLLGESPYMIKNDVEGYELLADFC